MTIADLMQQIEETERLIAVYRECFTYVRDWVEKKVRRHLAQARKRKGFGWGRWSRPWLYVTLGLFNSYRVRHDRPKVAPV